jgi:hypothetical protein
LGCAATPERGLGSARIQAEFNVRNGNGSWEDMHMKTAKPPLGLLSSLLLSVGFTKAAEIADPLHRNLSETATVHAEQTLFCETCLPCNYSIK